MKRLLMIVGGCHVPWTSAYKPDGDAARPEEGHRRAAPAAGGRGLKALATHMLANG